MNVWAEKIRNALPAVREIYAAELVPSKDRIGRKCFCCGSKQSVKYKKRYVCDECDVTLFLCNKCALLGGAE